MAKRPSCRSVVGLHDEQEPDPDYPATPYALGNRTDLVVRIVHAHISGGHAPDNKQEVRAEGILAVQSASIHVYTASLLSIAGPRILEDAH